jgi:hypothetical protein
VWQTRVCTTRCNRASRPGFGHPPNVRKNAATASHDSNNMAGGDLLDDRQEKSMARTRKTSGMCQGCVWGGKAQKHEGPIRRTERGGSDWEPIKILLEGD